MLYDDLIKGLSVNDLINQEVNVNTVGLENSSTIDINSSEDLSIKDNYNNSTSNETILNLFTVEDFKKHLKINSANSNKNFIDNSERLNAYDIVHSCIRNPIFRLLGTPIHDYSDNWLPVKLRGTIGSACHNFLQTMHNSFSENEIYLRIPSLNISVKIDSLIGNNILVEIKTCSYNDYSKILKTNHARTEDFYQALLYKYLLENHIDEAKKQQIDLNKYNLPKYDKYNIETIQMIYICHELFSSDFSSLDQALAESKELKRQLKSKYNYMWFIKVINYNLVKNNFDSHIEMIKEKIKEANTYLDAKQIPNLNHKYVDKSKCFFCLYKNHCSTIP